MQSTHFQQRWKRWRGLVPHPLDPGAEDMLGDPALGMLAPVCFPACQREKYCISLIQSPHSYLLLLVCAGLKIRRAFQTVREFRHRFTVQRKFPTRPVPQCELQNYNILTKKSHQVVDVSESMVLSQTSSLTIRQKFDIKLYMRAVTRSTAEETCHMQSLSSFLWGFASFVAKLQQSSCSKI